ncbi:MAG TPA: hypothetical protein PK054_02120 [Anaerohalosphaeraceae bacterium]|nr:hypothetical protein [Anaerohalosphaeraceae bacterium]HOL88108.1 hypothetical protein [Anaerohalosphaeraceae bacterium]HPP55356.1 hypothetical protein [Anaerohalosphaeraceae bacterium]
MKVPACYFALLVSFSMANPADLNSDYTVDLQDFVLFARCWQTQTGHPAYNSLCDLAQPKNEVIDVNDLLVWAENWLWHAIRLDIYSNGWGYYCTTKWLEGEGTWTIQFTDPLYKPGYDGRHYAYAVHPGDFTEVFTFLAKEIPIPPGTPKKYRADVTVDLDPIDPNRFNGTIFLTQPYFADAYLADTDVAVIDPNSMGMIASFRTDSQGRFSIQIEPGVYLFVFPEGSQQHIEEAAVFGTYRDFLYPAMNIMLKPNIYLYPPEAMQLEVQLAFPAGGGVTVSIPEYAEGWNITAEPNGLLDGVFRYLFYESVQPDYGQYESGWVVAQEDLEAFFRANLAQTGFIQKEIDDFVEYWIPRLTGAPFYAIYPQYKEQLDKMVQLRVFPPPDNVIRLIYAIRGLSGNQICLIPPQIPAFSREGFTVVEWGVVLQ